MSEDNKKGIEIQAQTNKELEVSNLFAKFDEKVMLNSHLFDDLQDGVVHSLVRCEPVIMTKTTWSRHINLLKNFIKRYNDMRQRHKKLYAEYSQLKEEMRTLKLKERDLKRTILNLEEEVKNVKKELSVVRQELNKRLQNEQTMKGSRKSGTNLDPRAAVKVTKEVMAYIIICYVEWWEYYLNKKEYISYDGKKYSGRPSNRKLAKIVEAVVSQKLEGKQGFTITDVTIGNYVTFNKFYEFCTEYGSIFGCSKERIIKTIDYLHSQGILK